MLTTDKLSIATSTAFGGVAGFLIFDWSGAVVGAVIGGLFAFGAAKARVRPMVATTTFVGAAAGALIGSSIVETICLPDSCVGLEIGAALVVGIASLIGVGLVAALVTRSFDEYEESVAAGKEPPTPGCELPESQD
ncbi:MAG: hypothetical protein M5U23_05930 [Acidimicrobiia bacterium]|nr:hypothetical protein [Acidimicrobiia bacterium]